MNPNRRSFLKLCGLAALNCFNLSLIGCGGKVGIQGGFGPQPTSGEGIAQAPQPPVEFLRRNDLQAAANPNLAIGSPAQMISFGHITDTHITLDDFSLTGNPVLEALLDSFGDEVGFGGLDRPKAQERYDVDVLQSFVRTMNAIRPPLKLVVHTGDAIDVGTMQELVPFLDEMNRSTVPWFQTIGNHDRLALGNIPPKLVEKSSNLDFVDTKKFIRKHFNRVHGPTLKTYGSKAMGFDFGPGFNWSPGSVKGFYSFSASLPIRSSSGALLRPGIRFYVLESTMIEGSALGQLDSEQISWLSAELDQHRDSLGIVISHHPIQEFTVGNDQLKSVLFGHPQVIAVLSGHEHRHRIRGYAYTANPERGFWQIQTSSLIDFPQQARILEVINNGDGTGLIRTFVFNQQADGRLGENARASYKSAAKEGFNGSGSEKDRDVELVFQFPPMT